MTKCRIAIEEPTQTSCDKLCCCLECDNRSDCKEVCAYVADGNVKNAEQCENAVVEGQELITFESKAASVIQAIADIATKKKALEEQDKKMREQLEAAMERYGVKSFENELVKVTYIEPTTRTSVDSAKLKKKYPDIFTECSKVSDVKASVKITVK